MQLKHYFLAEAAAMLLAMINFQSSQAASITYDTSGNSNVNLDKIQYTHGDRVGESSVTQPTVLQRGGTPGLRRLLQKQFPDWTFLIAPPVEGDSSLKGKFKIKQYYACDNVTDCGVPSTFPINYGVGALLDLDFIPGLGDPQYDGEFAEYKWIGRVTSNHSQLPSPNGSYGLIEDRIDNNGQTDNPFAVLTETNYYDVPNYYDRPYRGNPQDNHYWNSELFLAREIGTKTAVIYDGISWGWENKTFPNPACSGTQCPPPPPECTGGSGGGGCTINAAIYDEKLSDNNNNSSSTSIPESTSVLGLLTLAVWGILKSFKIRFNK